LEEKKMLTLIAELLGLDETGSALLTAYADEDEGHPRCIFTGRIRVKEGAIIRSLLFRRISADLIRKS